MPKELLKPNEAARIAEKFVQQHMKIDANKQRIETNRSMLCHSDELGQYYQVEGKVAKIRDKYSSVLESIFNGFSRTGNSATPKEYFFKLKVCAERGKILGYDFIEIKLEIKPSGEVVDMSAARESLQRQLNYINDSFEKQADTDLKRAAADYLEELKKDYEDGDNGGI